MRCRVSRSTAASRTNCWPRCLIAVSFINRIASSTSRRSAHSRSENPISSSTSVSSFLISSSRNRIFPFLSLSQRRRANRKFSYNSAYNVRVRSCCPVDITSVPLIFISETAGVSSQVIVRVRTRAVVYRPGWSKIYFIFGFGFINKYHFGVYTHWTLSHSNHSHEVLFSVQGRYTKNVTTERESCCILYIVLSRWFAVAIHRLKSCSNNFESS